jgi:hypothetical protein
MKSSAPVNPRPNLLPIRALFVSFVTFVVKTPLRLPPTRTQSTSSTTTTGRFPNLPQGDNTVGTAGNVKGALAWVEDLSGEEHTSYDARGRVDWVAKRIPDPLDHESDRRSSPTARSSSTIPSTALRDLGLSPDNDEIGYAYNERVACWRKHHRAVAPRG